MIFIGFKSRVTPNPKLKNLTQPNPHFSEQKNRRKRKVFVSFSMEHSWEFLDHNECNVEVETFQVTQRTGDNKFF
jgi:hypothetical protein